MSKVVIIDHLFSYTSANKSHTTRIFTLLIFNLIEIKIANIFILMLTMVKMINYDLSLDDTCVWY